VPSRSPKLVDCGSVRRLLTVILLTAVSAGAQAQDSLDPRHLHHELVAAASSATRTEQAYEVPDVTLRDSEGRAVELGKLLEDGRPLMLDFIYTSCAAICPLLSETFAQVQRDLGADAAGLRMVSISIDPEYDTPKVLRAYAQTYRAGPQWRFLTGDPKSIAQVQRAFDAFRANKMDHASLVFILPSRRGAWIRFEGLIKPSELVRELRAIRSAS